MAKYEITDEKFRFHGEWKRKGDIVDMTKEEALMFKQHVKPLTRKYDKVTSKKLKTEVKDEHKS